MAILPLEIRVSVARCSPLSYFALCRTDRELWVFFSSRSEESKERFTRRDSFGAPLLPDGTLHGLWERAGSRLPLSSWSETLTESILRPLGIFYRDVSRWEERRSYRDGLLEGPFSIRAPNQNVSISLSFLRGLPEGRSETTVEETRRTGSFFRGEMHGVWYTVQDGKVVDRSRFCCGKKMGRSKEGGKIRDFWLGQRHGLQRGERNGVRQETFLLAGRKIWEKIFYEDGAFSHFFGKERTWHWHYCGEGLLEEFRFSAEGRVALVVRRNERDDFVLSLPGSSSVFFPPDRNPIFRRRGRRVSPERGGKVDFVLLGGVEIGIRKREITARYRD